MNDEELDQSELEQARGLASVCTYAAILEHLKSWLTVDELHEQYHMKDKQIRIAKLALELTR